MITSKDDFAHLVSKHQHAVCTLVLEDPQYAKGAAVLAHSISAHNVKADLVCLVTNDMVTQEDFTNDIRNSPNLYIFDQLPWIPPHRRKVGDMSWLKILLNVFDHVVFVRPINYRVPKLFVKRYGPWISRCFSKLHVFRLVSYEKVLFLDADMLCVGDFSSIFQSFTCPFGTLTESEPGYSSGQTITKERLATSLCNEYGISAACFCIKPSLAEFLRARGRLDHRSGTQKDVYYETLDTIWPQCPQRGFIKAGPDEQLLGWMYFPRDGEPSWRDLSRQYNCHAWLKHKVERGDFSGNADDGIQMCISKEKRGVPMPTYIIHYTTEKPWHKCGRGGKIWPDSQIWFQSLESLRDRLGGQIQRTAGLLQGDIDMVLEPLRENDAFMSQEEADLIFEQDSKKKRRRKIGGVETTETLTCQG